MNIIIGCNAYLNVRLVDGAFIVTEQLTSHKSVRVNSTPLKTIQELLNFLFQYSLNSYEELTIQEMKDVINDTSKTIIQWLEENTLSEMTYL